MKLFIDSGAFIGRFNKRDKYHNAATQIFRSIANGDLLYKRLYTSNYVLTEAVTFILYETENHNHAVEVLENITGSKYLNMLWVDEEIQDKAYEVFKKYKDKLISLTDCTSAVLMKEQEIDAIFTFDRHFSAMGFKVVP